jgi:predicted nucleotidyltransferase
MLKNSLLEEKLEQLESICRKHRVARIEVFGSATGAAFDPSRSDLDFLVTFQDLGFNEYADAYFGLLEDLEHLFQRHIDLVTPSAIHNPYFLQSVDSTRKLIYAA